IAPEIAKLSRRGLLRKGLSLGSLALFTGCDLSTHSGVDAALWAMLDSTRENRRQEDFNNRVAQVKRPGDRRSVEWLCRRGGRRLRVCWPAGAGGWGGGGSGYWRAGRTAVCGRRERAGHPRPSPRQALNPFGGETIGVAGGVAGAVALQQPMAPCLRRGRLLSLPRSQRS